MKIIFTIFLTIIYIGLHSVMAFAWCEDYPDVRNEFFENELVFTGKVISEEKVHQINDFFDGIYYEIQIIDVFRGSPKETVTVFSENSSGRFPMEVGQSYLVFTSIEPQEYVKDTYAISNCGNSGKIHERQEALKAIKQLMKMPNKSNPADR
jgi:hypothetical protein